MTPERIGLHLLYTVAGCLIGGSTGKLLGYGIVVATKRLVRSNRFLAVLFLIFPWRTLVAAVIATVLMTQFLLIPLGLGKHTVLASVSVAVLALTVFISGSQDLPSVIVSARQRLLGRIRSLLVTASWISVIPSIWMETGAGGDLIVRGNHMLDFALLRQGLLITAVVSLVSDIMPGMILMVPWMLRDAQIDHKSSGKKSGLSP